MAQGRSLLGEICKNFINSLKPRKFWGELRGIDHLGTKYYETTYNNTRGKNSRWFVPQDGESFDIEKPPEWETWLRHGRKEAPTDEEIQLNSLKRMTAAEKGRQLEKARIKDPDELNVQSKPAFPVYDEYELDPGIQKKKNQQ